MKFARHKNKPDQNQRQRPVTKQPEVFSYYAQRSGAPTVKSESTGRRSEKTTKIKRVRLKVGLIPSYIALFAMVIGVLYSLWLQPVPRVTVTSQTGTIHHETKYYQEQIENIWRRSVLNQSKLTIKSGTIRADILDSFPELDDVIIELPLLGRRPAITLKPARPALQLVSGTGVYFVSSSGKVMARVTDVSQNQVDALPLVRDEGGSEAVVGKVVIPQQQAEFLQKLYAQLLATQAVIQSITLPSNAANQADVRLIDSTYYIKFSTDTDPRQAVGAFVAARDTLLAQGVTPSQYIDVRVEEKVFYQ